MSSKNPTTPTKEGYHKVKQLKPIHLGKNVKYLDKVEGILKFLKKNPEYKSPSKKFNESILKEKKYQVYSLGILDTILDDGKTGKIKEQPNKYFYTIVNVEDIYIPNEIQDHVEDIYIPNEIQDHYKEEEPHPTYINKVTTRLSQLTRRRSIGRRSSSSSSSKKIRGKNPLLKTKPKP
jgi:hypothetical protein